MIDIWKYKSIIYKYTSYKRERLVLHKNINDFMYIVNKNS